MYVHPDTGPCRFFFMEKKDGILLKLVFASIQNPFVETSYTVDYSPSKRNHIQL
jgi:hypothetical protein